MKLFKKFLAAGFLLAMLSGCGDAPPSNSTKAMNEYFWGTYQSTCVPMSDRADFANMRQTASLPMGGSYIDHHFVQPTNWNNGAFEDKGELKGEIKRVVYHDDNCDFPALEFRIPFISGGNTYQSGPEGISLLVKPAGTVTALDEDACRYLEEQFEWQKLDIPMMDKKCEVDRAYDRGEIRFQPSRIKRYPNLERISNMPYEISFAENKSSKLEVRAPKDFFVNIFNWVAEYDFGRSPLAESPYKLIGTKRAGAP